ncbi:hypothetical protein J45TS6_45580 [Paenibacillus sp. J45TS6]|uniref:ATP-binding protein n=2 Tax=unclassified Paenibacillus TaxID=185978 RepID=UPI00193591E0|nr:ATP-binding protein [Paenibacillus sp. J45TS6]BCO11074.1 ATP-binding protein [Paenibacillus sp.]GIP46099.1 hypothetical protein J45TS6_45580 [Paenibacillus sp. J45TS6]
MQMRNSIGIVNKVYPQKISIEIHDTNSLNYNHLGDIYTCDGINTFVTIHKTFQHKFIYQIISLAEMEKPYNQLDEDSRFFNKAIFEAVPLGEIKKNIFTFGLTRFPMINDDVYLTSHQDMQEIFNPLANETVQNFSIMLGSLAGNEGFMPSISIDKLLSNHMSILGNTGSGKSTTIRKLFNDIIESTNKAAIDINSANFLFFDIHDEYHGFPEDYSTTYDVTDELCIPLETLTSDDWINLVQPSSAVQLPVLLSGIRLANLLETNESGICNWIKVYCALELYNNVSTEVVGKRTKIVSLLSGVVDADIKSSLALYNSQFGNLAPAAETNFKESLKFYIKNQSSYEYEQCKEHVQSLIEQSNMSFKDLANLELGLDLTFLFEESKGNNQIRSYCSTLMTRINNIISTYSRTLFAADEAKLDRFNSLKSFNKGFTILKVGNLEDNDLLFFTGYFLRTIYNIQKEQKSDLSAEKKIFHFIFDEAHKYITENSLENTKSLKIFEQIAKEGRKFGVFMILASQRPGELSKTVLSQCNNFILHRIRNNIDLEQMRKSIPYINDSQLVRLSFLTTGSALLVGDAFSIPMEIIIDGKKFGEQSRTNLPSSIWRAVSN